jgi:hypothetical protein
MSITDRAFGDGPDTPDIFRGLLAGLAGHPTLWHLTLAGNTTPVSATALRDLPNLLRLDLAEAEVVDIDAIAELTVGVLTLSVGQWSRLRARGYSPTGLRAAELGGHPSLAESIEWLNWMRPDRPATRVVFRGRL